jgi:hypothetical protein
LKKTLLIIITAASILGLVPATGRAETVTQQQTVSTPFSGPQTAASSTNTASSVTVTPQQAAMTSGDSGQSASSSLSLPSLGATQPQQAAMLPGANKLSPAYPMNIPKSLQNSLSSLSGKESAAPTSASDAAVSAAPETKSSETENTPTPSYLETLINSGDKGLDEAKPLPPLELHLEQFGYNFFDAAPGFSPLTDIPVGPDYVVGPGDSIMMTASGSLEGTWTLEVNRSGEVVLPKVGTVRVWGVPFSDLSHVLETNLSKSFKNCRVSVTMGKLRLILARSPPW